MTKVQLNQKEQHYADTHEEAKEIVVAAEEKSNFVMQKITEKHNKYGQYFLVDLTYNYNTPKDVMENGSSQKDEAPEGQLSIEEVHEGIPYSVETNGNVSVAATKDDDQSEGAPF